MSHKRVDSCLKQFNNKLAEPNCSSYYMHLNENLLQTADNMKNSIALNTKHEQNTLIKGPSKISFQIS